MENFISTPDNTLLIANGVDPILRWRGESYQAEPAGVLPPTTALTITSSGSGDITGTYAAYSRFRDRDGNYSNLSPISDEVTVTDALTITYTNVPVPTESKVATREILRNLDGEALSYYVDVSTDDLSSTSLSSTKTDEELATQTEVPILNSDGTLNANQYTVPPSHKSAMAHHLGRMFYAVDGEYSAGHIILTFGSATVSGVGTEWPASLDARYLHVGGAGQSYQIDSVDEANQTLTLTEVYQGASDLFASYCIRPAPAERRLAYWSQPNLPEAVPAINAIGIQETGDELSGLMSMGSYLFVLERRHIHRWTFQANPATDGAVFRAVDRGCINQRCWALADNMALMLDQDGIHAFDGSESQAVSEPIADMFQPGDEGYRVNWAASRWFHAVHFPSQGTVRFFVALHGDYLPKHAIEYNYRLERWFLEEYAVPIGASCLGTLNGQGQVFLGTDARRVQALWRNYLDGANADLGTVRGTVTSSDLVSITDSAATFSTSTAGGVVGSPVVIVSGAGKGQMRVVAAVTATRLTMTQPWLTLPDTSSVYQVGGIAWQYRSGRLEWYPSEQQTGRKVRLIFNPSSEANLADLRVYHDQDTTPVEWQHSHSSDGFTLTKGDSDAVCDLTKANGNASFRMNSNKEADADGVQYMALELAGVAALEQVRIRRVVLDGVMGGRG